MLHFLSIFVLLGVCAAAAFLRAAILWRRRQLRKRVTTAEARQSGSSAAKLESVMRSATRQRQRPRGQRVPAINQSTK